MERSRIQTVKYLNFKIGSVRISYAHFAALGYSITYYKKLKNENTLRKHVLNNIGNTAMIFTL